MDAKNKTARSWRFGSAWRESNVADQLRHHWARVWGGKENRFEEELYNYKHLELSMRAKDAGYRRTLFEAFARFDLIICEFPTIQCGCLIDIYRMLEAGDDPFHLFPDKKSLANTSLASIFLRFSHRFHHHFRTIELVAQHNWLSYIDYVDRSPRHLLFANNPYDQAYTEYIANVKPLSWPTLERHVIIDDTDFPSTSSAVSLSNRTYAPRRNHGRYIVTVHGDAYTPEGSRFSCAFLNYRLNLIANEIGGDKDEEAVPWEFRISHKHCSRQNLPLDNDNRNITYGQLQISSVLQLLLPYAMHTGAFNELLTRNVPLLLPSPSLMASLHAQGKLKLTHAYFDSLSNITLTEPMFANRTKAERPCASPALRAPTADSSDEENLRQWLAFCDYYNWPNVFLFNEFSISDVHDSIDKLVRSQNQLRAASHRARQFLEHVEAAIKSRIVRAVLKARHASKATNVK